MGNDTQPSAIYAGSFDSFTEGHKQILVQAVPLYSKITVAVGMNPAKKTSWLSLEDRLALIQDVASQYPNVVVDHFFSGEDGEYQVDYAERIGASYTIRGIRNSADMEYELSLSQLNKLINPKIQTVLFFTDRKYADISSSTVRALIGPKGWQNKVQQFIPVEMWEHFLEIVAKVS